MSGGCSRRERKLVEVKQGGGKERSEEEGEGEGEGDVSESSGKSRVTYSGSWATDKERRHLLSFLDTCPTCYDFRLKSVQTVRILSVNVFVFRQRISCGPARWNRKGNFT